VWLGRALTCVDNTPGDNYGRFTVEWWTPMKGKREGKRALAAPLSSSRTGFLPIENPVPPATHVIPKASAAAAMATLAAHGIAVDAEEDWED
jgi:hypothetical protein